MKHHRYHGHVSEIDDDKAWRSARGEWARGAPHRRGESLVQFTAEAAEVVAGGGGGSGGRPSPAGPHAVATGLRLCALFGVPHNVDSLASLGKLGLAYPAVAGLLGYRDPSASGVSRAGPASSPAAAAARAVADNCEPLAVACGAHLHWHLGRVSALYWRRRVLPSLPGAFPAGADGVPPEYERYQRLLYVGQSNKVRRRGTVPLLPTHGLALMGKCARRAHELKIRDSETTSLSFNSFKNRHLSQPFASRPRQPLSFFQRRRPDGR